MRIEELIAGLKEHFPDLSTIRYTVEELIAKAQWKADIAKTEELLGQLLSLPSDGGIGQLFRMLFCVGKTESLRLKYNHYSSNNCYSNWIIRDADSVTLFTECTDRHLELAFLLEQGRFLSMLPSAEEAIF